MNRQVEEAYIGFCDALLPAQRLDRPEDREAFARSAMTLLSKAFAPEIAVQAAEEILMRETEWTRS